MLEYDAEEVTAYLHQHIPITRAMQLQVLPPEAEKLSLTARLAPNLNHQETAFGGSIASIGILAGWTLIHLRLRSDQRRHQIVIQKSEIDFLRPIEADFSGECLLPTESDWEPFLTCLERKGRARIELQPQVTVNGKTAATIKGLFVARVLSDH
ncbi:YiiD C-terminal domain-containing protein [Gimesia panareensis]|uniref:YiiD C-terminal domain-containing protein n=1 Tax=Gimesia panareensis TaxID=2527978 RepID=UPI00118AF14A|nr:YiiD C-terminal domain-containing protein [Gimesia panareensis]QDU50919.1 Putative thioesterase (yiiD_Cterm) [Gimesia panareensis]